MDRKIILAKVLKKLAILDTKKMNDFLNDLKDVSDDPKQVILFVQNFQDEMQMNQQEKIKLLGEIKKKGLIKVELPNMDRAWRLILKNWGLSHYPIRD